MTNEKRIRKSHLDQPIRDNCLVENKAKGGETGAPAGLSRGRADKIVRGGGRAVDEARGGGRVAHEARGGALDTGDAGGLLVHVLNASEVVSEIAHWPLNGVQKPR